jgi:hypothetical protein
VKKVLCVVMFIALFSFVAFAQGIAPVSNARATGKAAIGHHANFHTPGAPALCHGKCPFYGGDIDLNDPNANAFANANTTLVPLTYTYSALKLPVNAMITGMLINNDPTVTGGVQYDPVVGLYDVRTGVTTGSGGTDVGNGSNKLYEEATGRDPFGLVEESVASLFTSPISVSAGTTYWFNYLPQCTASDCDEDIYYFESNTDGLNNVNGKFQVSYQAFFDSSFFGVNWENWCDYLGSGNTTECQGMSYALAGNK